MLNQRKNIIMDSVVIKIGLNDQACCHWCSPILSLVKTGACT